MGEPAIRPACSPVSAWSAFLMPFLPLFTGIRHLAHDTAFERLSFLFKKVGVCGHCLVTLSITFFWNIKMVLIAAHLNAEIILYRPLPKLRLMPVHMHADIFTAQNYTFRNWGRLCSNAIDHGVILETGEIMAVSEYLGHTKVYLQELRLTVFKCSGPWSRFERQGKLWLWQGI